MPLVFLVAAVAVARASVPAILPPNLNPKNVNFESRFGKFKGAFILKEVGGKEVVRYGGEACKTRHSPCSTFKIPNALIGLETGVLKDENTLFKWDGKPQHFKTWERDHTLASAIKESCVWYFQEVARKIGNERMKSFLDKIAYGNRDISGGIDRFWLDQSLQISAEEQVAFMEKLYTGKLPFSERTMTLVKKLLVYAGGDGWNFSGKTGTSAPKDKPILGWFVGHLKSGEHEYVFALNIRATDDAWGPTARQITMDILKDMALIPAKP